MTSSACTPAGIKKLHHNNNNKTSSLPFSLIIPYPPDSVNNSNFPVFPCTDDTTERIFAIRFAACS
jgi:hypothetical protein